MLRFALPIAALAAVLALLNPASAAGSSAQPAIKSHDVPTAETYVQTLSNKVSDVLASKIPEAEKESKVKSVIDTAIRKHILRGPPERFLRCAPHRHRLARTPKRRRRRHNDRPFERSRSHQRELAGDRECRQLQIAGLPVRGHLDRAQLGRPIRFDHRPKRRQVCRTQRSSAQAARWRLRCQHRKRKKRQKITRGFQGDASGLMP